MKDQEKIRIIRYERMYAYETTEMWRNSKEQALGVKVQHSFENHLNYLQEQLVQENQVFLALDTLLNKVVGLLAVDREWVNQLYIHIDYQRQGIGTRLLHLAKELSPDRLKLFTLDVNTNAQKFYEKHGFRIIGRGIAEQEQLPDIEYEWVLGNRGF